MRTALDSSVILDVITDDPSWGYASEKSLYEASTLGQLVICECVLAEIVPALGESDIQSFLSDWKISFEPSTVKSATLAGEMYRLYLGRKGMAKRVLPDFLIGAHAAVHTSRLLARDRGYYRDYFKGLVLVEPGAQKLGTKPT